MVINNLYIVKIFKIYHAMIIHLNNRRLLKKILKIMMMQKPSSMQIIKLWLCIYPAFKMMIKDKPIL
jgi:hypothetical protein